MRSSELKQALIKNEIEFNLKNSTYLNKEGRK